MISWNANKTTKKSKLVFHFRVVKIKFWPIINKRIDSLYLNQKSLKINSNFEWLRSKFWSIRDDFFFRISLFMKKFLRSRIWIFFDLLFTFVLKIQILNKEITRLDYLESFLNAGGIQFKHETNVIWKKKVTWLYITWTSSLRC